MGSLALIVTLYGQRSLDNLPRLADALAASTRSPDELWLVVEGREATEAALDLLDRIEGYCEPCCAFPGDWPVGELLNVPTPRNDDGTYAVIPYALKINAALHRSKADYVAYLTDDSWPAPEKYERMVKALDENPEWGAVFCSQDFGDGIRAATDIERDAYCRVDHTQVMHRRTKDRWPTDIGDITLGDAIFWRRLHESLGPFYPMGPDVLDYVRQTQEGISAGRRS